MAATISKPPDANDTRVTFDIPKELAPFVRDWFAARMKVGEAFDDFVCRVACEEGVRYVMTAKLGELRADRATLQTADDVAIGIEFSDLLQG